MQYTKLKIRRKTESGSPKTVYDLCVEDVHTYISENGIINHNSGINFNASVTLMLSTSKLEDKDNDKAAEGQGGEILKTGVVVTARPQKSRFTIPHAVRFQIPFYKAPNPYVGIESFLNWENSGIMQGNVLDKNAYAKLSESDKALCKEMKDENGNVCYAFPKATARSLAVKHLGKQVPLAELFTPKVLTEEVLRQLDETTIRPSFELPTSASDQDIDELLEKSV